MLHLMMMAIINLQISTHQIPTANVHHSHLRDKQYTKITAFNLFANCDDRNSHLNDPSTIQIDYETFLSGDLLIWERKKISFFFHSTCNTVHSWTKLTMNWKIDELCDCDWNKCSVPTESSKFEQELCYIGLHGQQTGREKLESVITKHAEPGENYKKNRREMNRWVTRVTHFCFRFPFASAQYRCCWAFNGI